ncbi:MAG: N-acetylmuramoyl-L-alanine amidase [Terriglobales bacterium]
MEHTWIGCPESNFRKGRPLGFRPEDIVIHIMDGSFAAGESVFLSEGTQKSAHYGISKQGVIHQYVDENDTAFHAGIVVNPTWELLKPGINPNFYTIGIEHEGRPDDVWPGVQLTASAGLIGEIVARWNIPVDPPHLVRHHQIRAGKTCPGNWLQMDELIQRVPNPEVVHSAPIITVKILKNVNLRKGVPNTTAQIVRVLLANSEITVSGFTLGERVNGNACWYVDTQKNYLWAGATDIPKPMVVTAIASSDHAA